MKRIKQPDRVLDYIERFGSISTLEAFNDLGVARLASRIHDLKKQGYEFDIDIRCRRNRYGEKTYFKVYSLAEK